MNMTSTSYEVLVMQGGSWRIHAQFPEGARDDAIEEAKTLEDLPGIAGIKVVRDSYDDRTGLHREHVIHKHIPKRAPPPPAADKYAHYKARAAANRATELQDPFNVGDAKAEKSKPTSGIGVFIKLLLVLLFSIAASAVLTGLMSELLPTRIGDLRLVGTMRGNVMIVSALLFFVAAAVIAFKMFMGSDELSVPEFERQQQRRNQQSERQRRVAEKRKAEEKKRAEEKKKRTAEEEKELKKRAELELQKKAERDAEAEKEAAAESEAKPEEEPVKEEATEEEAFSRLSPMAEKQKALLMAFFGEAIRNLPAERKKMDNYNRFGVNLYLAGAAEALGGERNLDGETITLILADALQLMGLKPEHADAFARRYEDYLLQDARYMEMFQAGRRSLSGFLGGDKEAAAQLDPSLHEWNKPKAPEDPEKEVVVMFTDIVGSTAMTHEKGNLAAQEVVRAHNRVVRDALAKTKGKEIKHTGDGIMASFENVTNSLRATQQMQLMIRMHNAQNPDVPLHVKIGINAGRVVMEEQDLYGVTVQMAARIVDKAKSEQIMVSDIVYGLAQGGHWRFAKHGPFYMKGIEGPAYLQELVWDDAVDLAAAQAQADAQRPQLEQAYVVASGKPLPGQAPPVAESAPAAAAEAETPAPAPAAAPLAAQPPAAAPAEATPAPQPAKQG